MFNDKYKYSNNKAGELTEHYQNRPAFLLLYGYTKSVGQRHIGQPINSCLQNDDSY